MFGLTKSKEKPTELNSLEIPIPVKFENQN